MKRFGPWSVAATLLALALPAAAAEQTFEWSGTVDAGKAIEIKGVNGGIEASGSTGGEVTLTAIKKGKKSDPSTVKIEVVEHAGGVTICAVYPSDGPPNECKPGDGGRMKVKNNDVSVKFMVKVPAGVRFVGRTVNGGITARDLQANAEAHTVNGGVELESTGTARAKTVNGGIDVRFGRADWEGTLKLETVNGGIHVALPANAGVDVKAATVNGDIETEFPLTVRGKIGRRRLEGSIGGGGRLLEMETVNGGIELNKAS
ncbi:MAG: DUF4097 family beta strand repeat-containing protein [Acidobacteriota bacterium]|jgi:hypothetical protein